MSAISAPRLSVAVVRFSGDPLAASSLEQSLAGYLRIRRARGFKLEGAEKLLAQHRAHLDAIGEARVTVQDALSWARLPFAGSGSWWALRLSAVRGFATYLHALDPKQEVAPPDALARRPQRAAGDGAVVSLLRIRKGIGGKCR